MISAGIACCILELHMRENVVPRSDNGVAADMYSGADDSVAAEPDVVSDGHFFAVLIGGIAGNRMDGMAGGINSNIGRKQTVVAYCNLCHVQKCANVIGIEIFARFNMLAVIAVKRRIHKGAV